ncbi:Rpn family recombination-promoting nuclease/putative transposase [Gracilibacillus oryzae]|uniref:Rpn family recombination-promoting nuclease/putative transposase n=1 Tax=Gracilibacillus oryzae TaxID=1672701 RepID=A0A7C8GQ76_9BACI|nr:Rpn family recombination-promoting nuclease/putative transposase [Gracilibacillus oryzae]
MYRNTIASGRGYSELKPVIMINFMNFTLFKKTEKFHTTYHIYEDEEHFPLTDILEMHFFEMPKLLNDWKKGNLNPRNDILARWILLLGIVDKKNQTVYEDIYKELEDISMNDPQLREAFQDWEKLSADKGKWREYEARSKVLMDDLAALKEAELRERQAREEGIAKGKAEGLAEGKAEGQVLRLISSIKQFLQARSSAILTEQVKQKLENSKDLEELEELQLKLFTANDEDEIKTVVGKFFSSREI